MAASGKNVTASRWRSLKIVPGQPRGDNVTQAHRAPTAFAIAALSPGDREAWEQLARSYHSFYEEVVTPASYASTWSRLMRGDEICGYGAYVGGELVGITHCLFHAHVWDREVCYLQDLFVHEQHRGNGLGRALIEHTAGVATGRGAFRVYWTTKADNERARRLYDDVAAHNGFIRYELAL